MLRELSKVIIGQTEVLNQILASIFSSGHCLLVGVPGLAKTMMVRSVAQVLALNFKRIQFTPDLMPADITGTYIIQPGREGKREFRFVHGPIFANIILADEINRTPPKTQAALLEAMQERQVTVGSTTYDLPKPFFVIATQNPIEQEGTYPLPEAQLDRFMFNVHVGYPAHQEEVDIYLATSATLRPTLQPLLTGEDILLIQSVVREIAVTRYHADYAARLVRATRPQESEAPDFIRKCVEWGAGPRAGQYLLLGAKAMAAMDHRVNISCQDIRSVAIPVLRHRLGLNFQAQAEGLDSVAIIHKLLESIPEPEVKKHQ
ncbi:MAG TPA: MoxR family ATPase [Planctomycetota bacterium]